MSMNLLLKDTGEEFVISESIFKTSYSEKLVAQVIKSFQYNSHLGTKAQLSKGQVNYTGKKPHRQKGSGRARAGSFGSPIRRGGGVTFASSFVKKFHKINKKMYRNAIKSIFTNLMNDGRIVAFNELILPSKKTKDFMLFANKHDIKSGVLFIVNDNENLSHSVANVPGVDVVSTNGINPCMLMKAKLVIFDRQSLVKLQEVL